MTQESPTTPKNSSAPDAVDGSEPATKTGLPSAPANTSTTVDSGAITATPFSGLRHEEYMKKKAREEKRRVKAQGIYKRLMKSSTNVSGDSQERWRQAALQSDAAEQSGKEAYGNVEMVSRPSHYNQNGIECIDAIHAALGDEGFINYCHGNCMKYTWRWQYKGGLTDLDKSAQYAEFIKNVSNGKPPRG